MENQAMATSLAELIEQLEHSRTELQRDYDATDDQDARADIADSWTQLGVEIHECQLAFQDQDS